MGSERDLAKEFKVSYMTLRAAISLLAQEKLVVRRQGKGTFVAEMRLPASSPEPRNVAVASHEGLSLFADYYGTILKGIEAELDSQGMSVQIHCTKNAAFADARNALLRELLRQRRVGGLILLDPLPEADLALLIAEAGSPIVSVDPYKRVACACIPVDFGAAMGALVHRLHSQGHRRIGLLLHPLDRGESHFFKTSNAQHMGYVQALRDVAVPLDPGLIKECADGEGGAKTAELLRGGSPPTALIASSHELLLAARKVLGTAQRKVPEGVALAGFVEEGFDSFYAGMVVPTQQRGEMAARRLLELMRGEEYTGCPAALTCRFRAGQSMPGALE